MLTFWKDNVKKSAVSLAFTNNCSKYTSKLVQNILKDNNSLTSVFMFLSIHPTGEKILVSWFIRNTYQWARLLWVTPIDRALRPS